ncbi:hypothetical protein KY311_04850 [Candidatus Woesearchaeota archaeon]|nr:hypothetical protein [Candidatus Woesearchaeota archaeon]
MKLIVTSQLRIAGTNIYNLLRDEFGFEETGEVFDAKPVLQKDEYVLINIKKDIIELEYLNEFFKPDIYLIGSTHKSETGMKSLTVHSPGNWFKADMGGKERELSYCPALQLRASLLEIIKHPKEEYVESFEVTHHGPSEMNAPIVYVEVGGSESEWQDLDACRIVCQGLLAVPKDNVNIAVGFGGPHYAPNFSKPKLLEQIAVGHICPKYQLDNIDEQMVIQAFEKTVPRPEFALIDWKGCNKEQRDKLIAIFEKNSILWKRMADFS